MTPLTLFKCLSEDTRLRIMMLIFKEKNLCVCELCAALEGSQPKISRHLAQLRKCGVLQDKRQEQWIYYEITSDLPAWAITILTVTAAEHSATTGLDQQRLRQMANRPERICC